MASIQLTSDNFDEIVDKAPLLLIDFTASWCGPCQGYQEVLERVAADFPEFTFAQVDIDHAKDLAEEFQIKSVPSTLILRDNVIVCAHSGALTLTQVKELLEQTKALPES